MHAGVLRHVRYRRVGAASLAGWILITRLRSYRRISDLLEPVTAWVGNAIRWYTATPPGRVERSDFTYDGLVLCLRNTPQEETAERRSSLPPGFHNGEILLLNARRDPLQSRDQLVSCRGCFHFRLGDNPRSRDVPTV